MKPHSISRINLARSMGAVLCLGACNAALADSHPPAPPRFTDCHAVSLDLDGDGSQETNGFWGHPCSQSWPGPSVQTLSGDGTTTIVQTPEGQHPAQNPFDEPPGSNFLMTVWSNLKDFNGNEMPNTLPSTEDGHYNLHDGPVLTQAIDRTSPNDDLDTIIDGIEYAADHSGNLNQGDIQMALDILEGNPVDRAYSGFPMLHYNGPNKVKAVTPTCGGAPCGEGETPDGGNVDVHLIYWDQHIEGDTAFVDPSAVQNAPWTITYTVDILHGGIEDFSPMVMHFDQLPSGARGPFHASMDQSYFPMLEEGTRYTVKIKETLGKHYNLTYIWGWRIHPPRVQVIENALKTTPDGTTLPQHEINVFGADPMGSEANKLAAIGMIGDLSPAKKMWNIFRTLNGSAGSDGGTKGKKDIKTLASDLRTAFLDWSDRTKLPTGVEADPNATITLFYVNNTIYGSRQGLQGEGSEQGPASYKGISNGSALDWTLRPYLFNVTLYNGDHFPHGYMNVDFGGSRGWENQFQYTDPTTVLAEHEHNDPTFIQGDRTDIVNGEVVVSPGNFVDDHVLLDNTTNPAKAELARDLSTGDLVVSKDKIFPMNSGGTEEFLEQSPRNPNINGDPQLGSGCFFTFGRNWAWPNAGGPWGGIMVPPVGGDGVPGVHKVQITYNFEPSQRLRIYQFDPLHHDVAVYSLH
ncbi:MAG: hypothetical protein ACU833_12395 [Gammaproteobacteria bacterium]